MSFLALRPLRLSNPLLLKRSPLLSLHASSLLKPSGFQAFRNAATQTSPVAPPKPLAQAAVSASARTARGVNKYPERLLIFHAPASTTAWIGSVKVASIFIFGMGCFVVAPAAYFSPDMSAWLAPIFLAGSAIPMLLVSFMTSPFIASVFIRLPAWARRSKESVLTFSRRLPADTPLEIQKIGFLPFPRTRGLQLSELRTIQSTKILANLEHVPHAKAGKRTPAWARLAHYYLFARPTPSHWLKTPAPEVWPLVLDQISRNSVAAPAAKSAAMSAAATTTGKPIAVKKKNSI